MKKSPLLCPCGSNLIYEKCCGAFHQQQAIAPTAEALMRSRYSAYVFELTPYLLDSWHTSARPATLEFTPQLKWVGLDVIRHEQIDKDHAIVEFIARYKINGRAHKMHEISRFVLESGRWFYVDGE